MLKTKDVQKIETHILSSIIFFFENRAVYYLMWENIVQLDWPQMTIWRMRIACRIPKATDTHSVYVILLFHCNNSCTKRASILHYTYVANLVNFTSGRAVQQTT